MPISIRAVLNSAASSGSRDRSSAASAAVLVSRSTASAEPPAQRQRLAERQRDLTAPRPVRGARQRLAEVICRGDGCLHGLELAEAEQNLGPLGGWRRFCQRPLQAERGHVGGAAAASIGRGGAQLAAPPRRPRPGPTPAGGRSPPPASALGVEHPRGPQMPALPDRRAPGPGRPPSAPAGARTARACSPSMSRSAISAPTASAQASASRPASGPARAVVAAVPSTATARAAARQRRASGRAGAAPCGRPCPASAGAGAARRRPALDPLGREAGQQRLKQQRVAAGEFAAGVLERRGRGAAQRRADQSRRTRQGSARPGGARSRQVPRRGRRSAPCPARWPTGARGRSLTSSTGRPSRRRARCAMNRSDGWSAQCRSSTASSSGARCGDARGQPVQAVHDRERVFLARPARHGRARERPAPRRRPLNPWPPARTSGWNNSRTTPHA